MSVASWGASNPGNLHHGGPGSCVDAPIAWTYQLLPWRTTLDNVLLPLEIKFGRDVVDWFASMSVGLGALAQDEIS